MSTINKTNVVNGNTIQANDILNVINALDGTTGTSIIITADLKQGTGNVTDNATSHAEGVNTRATGVGSHTEGTYTTASGQYSHAEGLTTIAFGSYSHAEGKNTVASGSWSHAEGDGLAVGDLSHAEGTQTITGIQTAYSSSVSGGLVTLDTVYGDVTSTFTAGNLLYLYDDEFDGNYAKASFTIDTVSFSASKTKVQLVDTSVATTKAYVGDSTYLANNLIFGGNKTIPGNYSHAEGNSTFAIGDYAHTEGEGVQALGGASHAEGFYSQAVGNYSHAEGYSTQAIGETSHAEGRSTKTIGVYSHAEGQSTQAIGNYSHAEGSSTKAIGDYSHAEGQGTIASGSYQHVSGKYNEQGDTTSLFIVGNGGSDGGRIDAFKVTHSSSIVVNQLKAAPTWTGSAGEMVPVNIAGSYYLYMWVGAAGWKRASFT